MRFRRDCHFASKLVHVCDVYDALRTTRPLAGEAWPQELYRHLSGRTCRLVEFDAELVLAFTRMMRDLEPQLAVMRDDVNSLPESQDPAPKP